jgi:hypothetical protein
MNRRKLLRVIGSGLTAPVVHNSATSDCSDTSTEVPTEIDIKLFQTHRLQQKQKNTYYLSNQIQLAVQNNITEALSELVTQETEVTVTVAEDTIHVKTSVLKQEDIPQRFVHNAQWMVQGMDGDIELADHSNVLLDIGGNSDDTRFGIGWYGALPACAPQIDRFASVFLGEVFFKNTLQQETISRIILPEIGHNLGLRHKHGHVIQDGPYIFKSLMYSNRYAENHTENLYGEKLYQPYRRKTQFNPRIEPTDLVI